MKEERKKRRKVRIRAKVKGTKKCPRLSVFRSNKHLYAQLIDDQNQETLLSLSDVKEAKKDKKKRIEKAKDLGKEFAKKAKKKKISKVVFDRAGYRYHGIVKAFAEGARKGGLKF